MASQTVMQVYQGVVFECQFCYRVCCYQEAAVRRNCPHCGLPIANWPELQHLTQGSKTVPSETGVAAADEALPSSELGKE